MLPPVTDQNTLFTKQMHDAGLDFYPEIWQAMSPLTQHNFHVVRLIISMSGWGRGEKTILLLLDIYLLHKHHHCMESSCLK